MRTTLSLLTACLAALPAARAESPPDEAARYGWGLGIVVGAIDSPYKGSDNETRMLPTVSYENPWVRVNGLSADLKLGRAGPFSFALGARYSMAGYEEDDATILAGMEERKGGLWLGPSMDWRAGDFRLSAEVLGDVSGHSKGQQFRLGLDRSFRLGAIRLTPRIAAVWRDKKHNNYYYGVRDDEARADRPSYQAKSSTNLELGLHGGYSLGRQHLIFLDVNATRYGSGVTDSPLVDQSSSVGMAVGYLYRF